MKYTPSQIKADLKKAYEKISQDFSDTRSQAWPEFRLISDELHEDDKVLDLGCGNGRLYQYLTSDVSLKIDYTGLDFCQSFLSIAKKRYPQADFIEADISSFDLDKRFDAIVSVAAFHHLPSRNMRRQCLKRVFSHMEDDGTLIISVWNLWQWKYWRQHVQSFFSWISSGFRRDRKGLMIPFGKEKVKRYYHAFSVSEMKRLLTKQSFQVEHFELSRHNFFFICRKRMSKAQSQPIKNVSATRGHTMSPSHVATCK
jgi:SAM-dependent methyltransferase